QQRPTYLGADLRALMTSHPDVRADGTSFVCGGWTAIASGCRVALAATGAAGAGDESRLDALRALFAAAWRRRDDATDDASPAGGHRTAGGEAGGRVDIEASDATSAAMLVVLGLSTGDGDPAGAA